MACTPFFAFSHCQGGWQFNYDNDDLKHIGKFLENNEQGDDIYEKLSAEEAIAARENGTLTDEHIAQFGFFRRFDSDYSDLYAPINEGNDLRANPNATVADAQVKAREEDTQWRLLAHGIPAQSYAVAANAVDQLKVNIRLGRKEKNINMQTLREFPNGSDKPPLWPQERIFKGPFDYDWLHSDFRNVAMPYVYKMYDVMLDKSNLRGE